MPPNRSAPRGRTSDCSVPTLYLQGSLILERSRSANYPALASMSTFLDLPTVVAIYKKLAKCQKDRHDPFLGPQQRGPRVRHWQGPAATAENWRKLVARKLETIDWDAALRDVSPFLERKQDAALVSRSVLLPLLQSR